MQVAENYETNERTDERTNNGVNNRLSLVVKINPERRDVHGAKNMRYSTDSVKVSYLRGLSMGWR